MRAGDFLGFCSNNEERSFVLSVDKDDGFDSFDPIPSKSIYLTRTTRSIETARGINIRNKILSLLLFYFDLVYLFLYFMRLVYRTLEVIF